VVIEGAEKEELQRAPGHLIDTAPPGSKGNCVSPDIATRSSASSGA